MENTEDAYVKFQLEEDETDDESAGQGEPAYDEVDDDNVEIIDCSTQCEFSWDSLPDRLISWLKLNLMQRQQAEFYCAPWEVTEMELFPSLCDPKKRLKFIKDFEDFLLEVMKVSRPTKHQVRKKLR